MAYDLEEQEQLASIKSWWMHSGRLVMLAVIGVSIISCAIFGWKYYSQSRAASAALLFAQQQAAVQANEHKRVRDIAAEIVSQYGSTSYGPLAALGAAKSDFETGDLASAKTRLQWVIDKAKDEAVRDVARLRLSRILMDEKAFDQALQNIEAKHNDAFAGLFADIKGDILFALGKRSEARAAYQIAFDRSDAASSARQIVQLKLDAIGEAK